MFLLYSQYLTDNYSGDYREILYAVWADDLSRFKHFTNIPLLVFEITDEVENIDLCMDLGSFIGLDGHRVDTGGKKKYCIDVSASPALYQEPDWIENIPEE